MTKEQYEILNNYMLENTDGNAHDSYHIYRVLNQALKLAKHYKNINYDVLITSCLLHDIARNKQFKDKTLCHAIEGGIMAYDFSKKLGYDENYCNHVKDCITTHRFRSNNEPKTIEAKILFDSDKLDVMGALGLSRTLMYGGKLNRPLYLLDSNDKIDYNSNLEAKESFLGEYNIKLKNIYKKFYTKEAKHLAKKQNKIQIKFYEDLLNQIDLRDLKNTLNDHINK